MKKIIGLVVFFVLIILMGYMAGKVVVALPEKEHNEENQTFIANILEINSDNLMVKGTDENKKYFRKIYELKLDNNVKYVSDNKLITIKEFNIGDKVKVTFKGDAADIYPALLDRVSKIELLKS